MPWAGGSPVHVATPHAPQREMIGALVLLALITGCAGGLGGLPAVSRELKTPSIALGADTDTRLARSIKPLAAAYPGRSGFDLLGNGIDALAARLLLASRAERSIDLQYYLSPFSVTSSGAARTFFPCFRAGAFADAAGAGRAASAAAACRWRMRRTSSMASGVP